MSLPTAYLTSVKNLPDILDAMQSAQAPKKFTQAFLLGLDFKNVSDRLIIGVLKAIGFLNDSGEPTARYFAFLDQTQGAKVLAEGIQEAYADLFQVNKKAYELSNVEIRNKLKTLTQGQFSDTVLDKMAATFKALSARADFEAVGKAQMQDTAPSKKQSDELTQQDVHALGIDGVGAVKLGSLVYNVELHLPESRDPAVYDILFRSLKEHLLR